jgi:hypothetical protein
MPRDDCERAFGRRLAKAKEENDERLRVAQEQFETLWHLTQQWNEEALPQIERSLQVCSRPGPESMTEPCVRG